MCVHEHTLSIIIVLTPACLIRLVQAVQVALGRGKRHHLPWEVVLLAHVWPKLSILDLNGF